MREIAGIGEKDINFKSKAEENEQSDKVSNRGGALRRLSERPIGKFVRGAMVGMSLIMPMRENVAEARTSPPVEYLQIANDQIERLVNEKRPLAESDQRAFEEIKRNMVTDQFGNHIIQRTPDYEIDYINNPSGGRGVIQVKLTADFFPAAKDNATKWLQQQNLSNDAICRLPTQFYLDKPVAEKLRGQDMIFDPQAVFCGYDKDLVEKYQKMMEGK